MMTGSSSIWLMDTVQPAIFTPPHGHTVRTAGRLTGHASPWLKAIRTHGSTLTHPHGFSQLTRCIAAKGRQAKIPLPPRLGQRLAVLGVPMATSLCV